MKVLYAVKISQQPRPRVMYVTREGRREAFTGQAVEGKRILIHPKVADSVNASHIFNQYV